jgi:hypothetical protein
MPVIPAGRVWLVPDLRPDVVDTESAVPAAKVSHEVRQGFYQARIDDRVPQEEPLLRHRPVAEPACRAVRPSSNPIL